MNHAILISLGGLGVFLFGMVTMTDGLKGLAGPALRRGLARFTRSPTTGAISGAIGTALIQSSSATTVAAIGFVGAGLMSFSQALGIIFGANLGTTITGWFVGLLGLKLGLLTILWPVIFLGALLFMFARGRWRATGRALVGFGLVFVGLDLLQTGLSGFELTPSSFPDDTWGGRLLLVLLGLGITLLTQSSSAGVAAAMTAVLAGTIDLTQAAAMIIGMDVGTTITAVVASLGGNLAARRTGAAHVIYNVCTGVAAFFILPLYFVGWHALGRPGADDPQLVLVAFHSLFNGLGVVIVLPFTATFARLIERVVPDRGESIRAALPRRLLRTPSAAFDAVTVITARQAQRVLGIVRAMLGGDAPPELADLRDDLRWLREAVVSIDRDPDKQTRHVAAIHVIDHLDRLCDRIEQPDIGSALARAPTLRADAADLADVIGHDPALWIESPPDPEHARQVWSTLNGARHARRRQMMQTALESPAHSKDDPATELDRRLDAHRWIGRCAYNCWRLGAWWCALSGRGPSPDTQPEGAP